MEASVEVCWSLLYGAAVAALHSPQEQTLVPVVPWKPLAHSSLHEGAGRLSGSALQVRYTLLLQEASHRLGCTDIQ